MRQWIGTIIIGVLLLGTLTAAAGCGSHDASTTKTTQVLTSAVTVSPTSTPLTSTTTETTTIHTAQTESANGLRLSLSLDATTYKAGQEITITIDEQNTRSTANNNAAAQNWPMAKLAVGPCGTLNYPFGMAVFKGYFSSDDVVAAAPVTLYDPGTIYHCPLILAGITAYDFKASSNAADIIGACEPNPCLLDMTMQTVILVKGYWTTGSMVNLNNFDPGIYTVAAGDEWGNLAILHFTITK
jgi:hypothetical protein